VIEVLDPETGEVIARLLSKYSPEQWYAVYAALRELKK